MKILGIDYGEKRIGLAVGDTEYKIPRALEFVDNKSMNFAIKKIAEICKAEGVETIVIGLPLGLSGRETAQTEIIKKFTVKLGETVKLPLVLEDERLTSRMASDSLSERNVRGGRQRKKIDSVAAQLILQGYFEKIG